MKKIPAVTAVLAVLVLVLTACAANPLAGTWESAVGVAGVSVSYRLIFEKNGTYTLTSFGQTLISGHYAVNGDKVALDGVEVGYSISGNRLTIRIGDLGLMEFTKK